MNSPRYNTFLRTLYGAVLASRLSVSDLKALSEELRHGRLPDELAYMIDRALEHLRGLGEGEPEDERMAEAEYLIRRGRVSKATLASIMGSLGVPPSSRKDSARDMLRHFMNEVPPSRVTKFMEVLRSQQAGDEFLAGIGETRK